MSDYATDKTFGGQRASVGRVVLEGVPDVPGFEPRFIVSIDKGSDAPLIGTELSGPQCWPVSYFDVKTETGLKDLPVGSWCWPPRV